MQVEDFGRHLSISRWNIHGKLGLMGVKSTLSQDAARVTESIFPAAEKFSSVERQVRCAL